MQAAIADRPMFDAWSDEPWVIDGTAVRVSLICFSCPDDEHTPEARLDDRSVDEIYPDLTARRGSTGVNLTLAKPLSMNLGTAFMGDTKGGKFEITGELARTWLRLPANPNGRPNADVLKPWTNATGLTGRPAGKWIVDFGWNMDEPEAALYEAPFEHVQDYVYVKRQKNRREFYRKYWWRHAEPGQGMWRSLAGLSRYIATPRVAKHRLFVWCDVRVCPDIVQSSRLPVTTTRPSASCTAGFTRFGRGASVPKSARATIRATPRRQPMSPSPSPRASRPTSPPPNTPKTGTPEPSLQPPAGSSNCVIAGSIRQNGWNG